MNPNTVFSVSLVSSLVLWFPSMQACLRGDLDLAPAGLRYLAALAISCLAVGGLARLVNAYHAASPPAAGDSPMPAEPPPAGTGDGSAPPRRRRADRPGDGQADQDSLAA